MTSLEVESEDVLRLRDDVLDSGERLFGLAGDVQKRLY